MAYYTLEPFGEDRADIRAAIIASTIANVNRSKKQKAFKISDFIPEFGLPKKGPKDWKAYQDFAKILNTKIDSEEDEK